MGLKGDIDVIKFKYALDLLFIDSQCHTLKNCLKLILINYNSYGKIVNLIASRESNIYKMYIKLT